MAKKASKRSSTPLRSKPSSHTVGQVAALPLRRTNAFFGEPDPPPELPTNFAEQQELAAGRGMWSPDKPPSWFMEAVKKGGKPEDIIRLLRTRAGRASSLCEVQLILNEIGRLPGGAKLIRQTMTQKAVSGLQRRVR
jgi:hypothetical protein